MILPESGTFTRSSSPAIAVRNLSYPDYAVPAPGYLPDSGERTLFESGAVRDAAVGKGYPHMIPPLALHRLAKHFEAGARKYSNHNWMKGIVLSRFLDGIKRHTDAWAQGDESEDHAAAVLWNMSCAMWTEEQIKLGRFHGRLNDLPYHSTNL